MKKSGIGWYQRHRLLPRPACGERDGVRGLFGFRTKQTRAAGRRPLAPHPESACRLAVSDLSPQAGRGDRGRGQFRYTLKDRIARLGLTSVLLLVAPAGAMAQQGAARQACAADIKQLCAEVKPGDGRLKACVKEHFGQLSASCQTRAVQQCDDNQILQDRRRAKMLRHSTRRRAYPDLHEGPLHGIDRALQGGAAARQAPAAIAGRPPAADPWPPTYSFCGLWSGARV